MIVEAIEIVLVTDRSVLEFELVDDRSTLEFETRTEDGIRPLYYITADEGKLILADGDEEYILPGP